MSVNRYTGDTASRQRSSRSPSGETEGLIAVVLSEHDIRTRDFGGAANKKALLQFYGDSALAIKALQAGEKDGAYSGYITQQMRNGKPVGWTLAYAGDGEVFPFDDIADMPYMVKQNGGTDERVFVFSPITGHLLFCIDGEEE